MKVYRFLLLFSVGSMIMLSHLSPARMTLEEQRRLEAQIAINQFRQTVITLLDSGIPINDKDEDGRSPLFLTVCKGVLEVVELLLDRGAAIDTTDNSGLTPLHVATLLGFSVIVKLLLERGARTDLIDNNGRAAFFYAETMQNTQVIQVFTEHFAKQATQNVDKTTLAGYFPETN